MSFHVNSSSISDVSVYSPGEVAFLLHNQTGSWLKVSSKDFVVFWNVIPYYLFVFKPFANFTDL